MEIPEGLNSTNSPTTDSDTESLELAQVYVAAATNRGPVASMQRPHRPVFDRSANGTVVSPVEGTSNQPVRVPALVPNIRVSNFGVALPNQTAIAKPTVTDSGFVREDREPRDLKQALQYSLSLCDGNSPIKEVSEERKAILNDVMTQCFTSKISVLRQRLEYLHSVTDVESEIERKTVIDSLEAIDMEVELTDQANDFCNRDGMKILTRFVFSNVIEIRIAALNILATVVQNNPVGMKKALEEGILALLTEELVKIAWNPSDKSDSVAVKSLYALSCMLRGNPEGCKFFKEQSGFNHTMAILSYHHDPKILKKCYYIVVSLVADEMEAGESADISHIESDPWKLYVDLIMERFAMLKDSVAIATTLAQVLEQLCIGYVGRSDNFQVLNLMKEKRVLSVAQSYVESIDETCGLALSQNKIEMVKACKSLVKFIEPAYEGSCDWDLELAFGEGFNLCDDNSSITVVTQECQGVSKEVMAQGNTAQVSFFRQHLEYLFGVRDMNSKSLRKAIIDTFKAIGMEVKQPEGANEFCRNMGISIITRYAFSWEIEVRVAALNLLALVVHKNELGMKKASEEGILELLTDEVEDMAYDLVAKHLYEDSPARKEAVDRMVRDSLLVMSCLLRGNPEGCKRFKEKRGFLSILMILSNEQQNDLEIITNVLYVVESLVADELEQVESAGIFYSKHFMPWIYVVEYIMDRFTKVQDSFEVTMTLAKVLVQISMGYCGSSESFQMANRMKERNIVFIAGMYLDNLAYTYGQDFPPLELEMVTACRALLHYIDPENY